MRRVWDRLPLVMAAFGAGMMVAAFMSGCAHLAAARERQLACNEACARVGVARGVNVSSAWDGGGADCACRFDDDTTALTCRRPMLGGGCP